LFTLPQKSSVHGQIYSLFKEVSEPVLTFEAKNSTAGAVRENAMSK
jgi:hypothetical protein